MAQMTKREKAMAVTSSPEAQEISNVVAQNLQKYPEVEVFVLGLLMSPHPRSFSEGEEFDPEKASQLAADAIYRGCYWNFVCDPDSIRQIDKVMGEIQKNPNVQAQHITIDQRTGYKGYLVTMKKDYLYALFLKEFAFGNTFTQADYNDAEKHYNESAAKLVSLIQKKLRGATAKIGIFNTNDDSAVTIKGQTIPAFSITLFDACNILNKMGYGFLIGGKVRTAQEVWSHADALIERAEIAPQGNTMFFTIAALR